MSNPLKAPRGTTASITARVLAYGELAYNTDTDRLHIGDGVTFGGNAMLTTAELTGYQPIDADLTAIAALATTAYGRSLLTLADQAALGSQLSAIFQPLDGTLTALAGLGGSAGLLEKTGADTFTERALGVGASTSVPTRADADARYQGLDSDLTAIAALSTTAYGRALLELADLAALRAAINAGGGSGAAVRELWRINGANMNTTADQAFTKLGTFTSYQLIVAVASNPSLSMTTAQGGVYSATSKGGDVLVAASQAYATLTTALTGMNMTRTALGTGKRSDAALYFALTNAQGATATADITLYGCPLS